MALPRWLARLNRRFVNPREIRLGSRPVVTHQGRISGTVYQTPLDAHPLPDGYVFIPMYGPRTDWVRNILATGEASLTIDGREVRLEAPRLVRQQELWPLLPPGTRVPPGISGESELLRMDLCPEG